MVMVIKCDAMCSLVDLEKFFPCSKDNLKVLLKIVDMDQEDQDDYLNTIMQFLKKKEQETVNKDDVEILKLCQEEIKNIYGGSWE